MLIGIRLSDDVNDVRIDQHFENNLDGRVDGKIENITVCVVAGKIH